VTGNGVGIAVNALPFSTSTANVGNGLGVSGERNHAMRKGGIVTPFRLEPAGLHRNRHYNGQLVSGRNKDARNTHLRRAIQILVQSLQHGRA
jgi:hypothetical protein